MANRSSWLFVHSWNLVKLSKFCYFVTLEKIEILLCKRYIFASIESAIQRPFDIDFEATNVARASGKFKGDDDDGASFYWKIFAVNGRAW